MLPHWWQDDKENCSPQIPPQLPPTIRVRKGLRAQGDKEKSLPQLPQQQKTISERTDSAVSARRHELAHSRSPRTTRHLLLKQLGPSPSREALMAFVKRLSASERALFLGGPAPQTRLASTHGAPDQTGLNPLGLTEDNTPAESKGDLEIGNDSPSRQESLPQACSELGRFNLSVDNLLPLSTTHDEIRHDHDLSPKTLRFSRSPATPISRAIFVANDLGHASPGKDCAPRHDRAGETGLSSLAGAESNARDCSLGSGQTESSSSVDSLPSSSQRKSTGKPEQDLSLDLFSREVRTEASGLLSQQLAQTESERNALKDALQQASDSEVTLREELEATQATLSTVLAEMAALKLQTHTAEELLMTERAAAAAAKAEHQRAPVRSQDAQAVRNSGQEQSTVSRHQKASVLASCTEPNEEAFNLLLGQFIVTDECPCCEQYFARNHRLHLRSCRTKPSSPALHSENTLAARETDTPSAVKHVAADELPRDDDWSDSLQSSVQSCVTASTPHDTCRGLECMPCDAGTHEKIPPKCREEDVITVSPWGHPAVPCSIGHSAFGADVEADVAPVSSPRWRCTAPVIHAMQPLERERSGSDGEGVPWASALATKRVLAEIIKPTPCLARDIQVKSSYGAEETALPQGPEEPSESKPAFKTLCVPSLKLVMVKTLQWGSDLVTLLPGRSIDSAHVPICNRAQL